MLVKHNLTGSRTARSNAETINYIVKTAFEELEKHLAGDTLGAGCFLKEVAELTLEHTICVFSFLLLFELCAIFRSLSSAVGTMLSRRIVLLCQNFILAVDCFAEFAGDFGLGTCISCHCFLIVLLKRAF